MNKLSEYIEISSFNDDTVLVQNGTAIYVKKRVPKELTYIYKILVDNPHKNISDIIEIFEYEDCTVIIEEYINGKTLADVMAQRGKMTEKETKDIIGQVCDGLIFLHKHNIIHRDINPNNIMITKDARVKIIDFDISRSVKKSAGSDTVILGTVGYAAPEQFGFSQSGTRTDLYAVGILANVMLTGKMPNEKMYGGKLGRVIKRATNIDAKTRYRNIAKFKHAFTNEVDENTNPAIKILRCIPGFRTWSLWKMLVALVIYATYIPLMVLFAVWSSDIPRTILGEIFVFIIPYMLLADPLGLRSRISRKIAAALFTAIILSVIFILIGSYFISTGMGS